MRTYMKAGGQYGHIRGYARRVAMPWQDRKFPANIITSESDLVKIAIYLRMKSMHFQKEHHGAMIKYNQ